MEERDLLGKPACASLGMNEFWSRLLIPIAWCLGGNRSSALFPICKTAGEKTGVRLYFFSYNHWSRRGPTGGFLIHLFIYYFLANNQYHVGVLLRSLHCPSFGNTASGDRRAHGCTHSGSTQYTIYISYPGRIKVQM